MSRMLGFRSSSGIPNNNSNSSEVVNKHIAQPPDPDVLMRQMDRSIAAVEYARATSQLSKYQLPANSSDNGTVMGAKDESVLLAKHG